MLKRYLVLIPCVLACNLIAGQNRKDVSAIFSNRFPQADQAAHIANQGEYNRNNMAYKTILELPVLFYQQFISSQLKPQCFFYPSCSQYSLDAIRYHGVTGIFMGTDRIMRCNALAEGKYPLHEKTHLLYDPVDRYRFNKPKRNQRILDSPVYHRAIIIGQKSSYQQFNDFFGFGKYLYLEKDYPRAIDELEKALSLHHPAALNKSDSLHYLLGMSYSSLSDYRLSNKHLARISDANPVLFDHAVIQTTKNYILDGTADLAVRFASDNDQKMFSCESSDKLSSLRASAYLVLNDHESASSVIVRAGLPENELLRYTSELDDFQPKSTLIAGLLSSVVPGTGKFYAGNLDDGLMSMFTIGLLAFRTFIEYRRGGVGSPYFMAFGLISTTLYVGNIYGSVATARQYNQNYYHDIHTQVMDYVYEVE